MPPGRVRMGAMWLFSQMKSKMPCPTWTEKLKISSTHELSFSSKQSRSKHFIDAISEVKKPSIASSKPCPSTQSLHMDIFPQRIWKCQAHMNWVLLIEQNQEVSFSYHYLKRLALPPVRVQILFKSMWIFVSQKKWKIPWTHKLSFFVTLLWMTKIMDE